MGIFLFSTQSCSLKSDKFQTCNDNQIVNINPFKYDFVIQSLEVVQSKFFRNLIRWKTIVFISDKFTLEYNNKILNINLFCECAIKYLILLRRNWFMILKNSKTKEIRQKHLNKFKFWMKIKQQRMQKMKISDLFSSKFKLKIWFKMVMDDDNECHKLSYSNH